MLRPPVLDHSAKCEQPREDCTLTDDEPDSPPRYRSMSLGDYDEPVYRSAAPCANSDDELLTDDEPSSPVYRSVVLGRHVQAPVVARHPWNKVVSSSCDLDLDATHDRSMASVTQNTPLLPGADAAEKFAFELPTDLFEAVLHLLSSSPDLFMVMRVCKSWRRDACAHYLRRVAVVPAKPDALLRAIAHARAGDTLRLLPGEHRLTSELILDTPLRVLSDAEADRALAPLVVAATLVSPPTASPKAAGKAPAASPSPFLLSSAKSDASDAGSASSSRGGGDVVLVGSLHVLLRTRCTAVVAGITLCRMGDEVGYPNAVTYAEGGVLRMERCRVTCGGPATSVPQALLAFAGAPEPGAVRWPRAVSADASSEAAGTAASERGGRLRQSSDAELSEWSEASMSSRPSSDSLATDAVPSPPPILPGRPLGAGGFFGGGGGGGFGALNTAEAAAEHSGDGTDVAPALPGVGPSSDERSQCPQSGVWVGAAASVVLQGCTISACMGPGVKIYRGRLLAQCNTIAFSSRGANVVANGGYVELENNDIRGANGDGVSSWNNSVMRIERNSIHSNSGAGIAVNTGGGSVTIANNAVFDNACQAVLFATSSKQATLKDNDFDGATTKEGPPPPRRAGGVHPHHPQSSRAPPGPPLPRRQ